MRSSAYRTDCTFTFAVYLPLAATSSPALLPHIDQILQDSTTPNPSHRVVRSVCTCRGRSTEG